MFAETLGWSMRVFDMGGTIASLLSSSIRPYDVPHTRPFDIALASVCRFAVNGTTTISAPLIDAVYAHVGSFVLFLAILFAS